MPNGRCLASRPSSPRVRTHCTRSPFTRGSETFRFAHDGVRQRLALRHHASDQVRAYFRAQRFLEVETPAVVACPGLDVNLSAFGVLGHMQPTPSGLPTPYGFLITSPELHMKRLLVGGVQFAFDVPGFLNVSVLAGKEYSHPPDCRPYRLAASCTSCAAKPGLILPRRS